MAAGVEWEPDHVVVSFCAPQLLMSRWFALARACWISALPLSSEQRPLKSCQKAPTVSRVSAAMEVLISTR